LKKTSCDKEKSHVTSVLVYHGFQVHVYSPLTHVHKATMVRIIDYGRVTLTTYVRTYLNVGRVVNKRLV